MRRTLDLVGWLALGAMTWVTYSAVWGPERLPDRIATHFDIAGNPNGWGSPAVLLLPVIGVTVYVLMTVVCRFPAAFNYPVPVSPANRARAQELTVEMIGWLKMELACLFAFLQRVIVESARSGQGKTLPLLMPPFLVVVFATIGWYMVAIVRLGRGKDRP
jgi:uncharacterized membrane protein